MDLNVFMLFHLDIAALIFYLSDDAHSVSSADSGYQYDYRNKLCVTELKPFQCFGFITSFEKLEWGKPSQQRKLFFHFSDLIPK